MTRLYVSRFFYPPGDVPDGYYVRDEVFTKEQGFASPDTDQHDPSSIHLVIYDEDRPVATARVFSLQDNKCSYKLGRIAVLKAYRGKNLGRRLMEEMEDLIKIMGGKRVYISAQCQAQPFYQRLGYTAYGEVYLDEHCPHIDMEKYL
ncbi:GNAT family N-acetyltransferase [Youxingia wuxianensis]|uniref:GNAT family N-acetyltransferase n=1 Tax=Youxingia wuxianensis TaxID=2763678 RepID=A0A926IG43_9FIRM|nr:GNAT family N-acetyltransferase [Youxingia wuxianensis]MBC8584489.1 GNAT family N-acetyltransferase [Youxingia wuxianensis]